MTPMHPPGRGYEESSLSMLPFLGSFLLLSILLIGVAGLYYLHRTGRLSLPPLRGTQPPEADARRILADRFARGDIGSEEFLERSSTLNWTPGSDTIRSRPPRNRRPS